jgi:DNA-binding SARP family transcriptional activator/WD40 repeat protein
MVLQALSLHGDVVSPEQLAEVLWAAELPPSWPKVIQGCISRLRRSLGTHAIETTPDGYRLLATTDEIDVLEFERLVNRGRDLLVLGEPERADHTIRRALTLWRGQPFGDLVEWDTARIERERLNELRLDAEELAIDAALRSGRHREVLAEARARAEQQPLREGRWALLARAEYQSGRQTEALRALQRARELLATEVGLEPGPELLALEASILQHDPALDVAPAPVDAPRSCPFPGLVPYDVDDSDLFFGRIDVVAECLRLLDDQRVAAVVGPSGSGKSSVVRAGVAAALVRAGRSIRITTPGTRLADTATEIDRSRDDVLIVDQLEEAVTGDDRRQRDNFFDALVRFAERGQVVIAIRADRVGALAAHPPLARLVERGFHLLGAMTEDELRSAIEGPAARSGLLLEPGLVDLLVREVEGVAGALPLMSHALRRTWEHREDRVLTVSGYRETGGIRGAVSQTAETLYASLSHGEQEVVRDLLMRMVAPDPDGEPVRSAVPRRSISGGHLQDRVIELLVNSRLVTSDGTSIELAHEALVRAWPRLRTWLDDDVEGQRILRHLTLVADSWVALGRPDSELYRGVRLRAACEWRDRTHAALAPIEAEFLAASEGEHERAEREAAARANEQVRRNRQLRTLLAGAAVLLVIALIASAWATRSAGRANDLADAATVARARTLADLSRNVVDQDQSLSLLLAVEAHRLDDSITARGAMLEASFDRPLGRTSISTPADGFVAVAVDGDGTVAVAKRPDGQLDVVDLESRQTRHVGLPSAASPVDGLDVHPEGSVAVSSGFGPDPVAVYDLVDGALLAEIPRSAPLTFVRFSPTGQELAVSGDGGLVDIFDTDDWSKVATFDTGTGGLTALMRYDESGERLFLISLAPEGSGDPAELVALDARTGEVVAGPVETGEELMSGLATLPNGELALVGRHVERRNSDDLELIEEPFGFMEVDGLVTLDTGPAGRLIVGSPIDLQLFDLGDGEAPTPPPEIIERGAPGVAFVAATETLVTADIDGTVSTWTMSPRDGPGAPVDPAGPGQVTSSPDGSTLAIWESGHGVRLLEPLTLTMRAELDLDPSVDVLGVDIHEDRIVTLTCPSVPERCEADVDVWDTATGVRVVGPSRVGEVWPGLHKGVVFARNGTLVVTGDTSGFVRFWDGDTLDPVGDQLHVADHTALPGEQVWALTSVDVEGRSLLAVHDQLGQSITWDVTAPDPVLVGALENAFRMEFLSDGMLVTSSGRGALVLRDPFTLEPTAPVLPGTIPADSYDRSAGGVMIASGDHGAQLWDLDSGESVTGPIPAARSAISEDGTTLYLGAGPLGESVRTVSLLGDDLVRTACRRAGRNLTMEEWSSMIGRDREYRSTCPEWPGPPPD